ncbi:uncharacterized protein TNCV_3586891 [Trichonephila clavipes]|nr:uncharacterized protein TNCV_3586891 [Trichonephila clavipes]
MTNLGLKTLHVVPCYYHHTLPTMWEGLNTTSLSICRTVCELGQLLAHSISNVLSSCKPPTTYWLLNLGKRSKSQGQIKFTVTFHHISPSENGYFDVSRQLKTGYFHFTRHSPTD